MAAAPMATPARSMTSTVRLAQLQRPITQVFANRPMWVAPERKHWAVEASHANMYLSLGVGIVGTCALAQIIVAKLGGGKYENPRTVTKEWAAATEKKKMGKIPIYWETKVEPSDDDY